MHKRGFTFVEIMVVLVIVVMIMGVTVYKFKTERREQAQQLSRIDKQSNIRRFLMWFRQDMQSMDEIIQLSNSQVSLIGEDICLKSSLDN